MEQPALSKFLLLEKMCRLCGKDETEYDVYGEEGSKLDLHTKINECLPRIDANKDDFPWKICQRCVGFVNSWHEFCEKSLEVKNFLENYELTYGGGTNFTNDVEPKVTARNDEMPKQTNKSKRTSKFQLHLKMPFNKTNSEEKRSFETAEEWLFGTVKKPFKIETNTDVNTANDFKRVVVNGKMFYECYVCLKAIRQMRWLRRHLALSHNIGEQPRKYHCDHCGKSFFQKAYILNHMRVHYPLHIPRHVCPMCGKSFQYKWSLSKHMKSEMGDTDHQCATCGECFGDRSTLKMHMLKHSEDYNYPCPVCGNMFKHPRYVTDHMREVHANEVHQCHLCPATFACLKYLKNHLKKKKH